MRPSAGWKGLRGGTSPGEGYEPTKIEYALELDMKFGGQLNVKRATSPVLRVQSQEDVVAIREAFEQEYAQAYSPLGLNPEAGIEIHNFVLRGRVAQPKPELPASEPARPDPPAAQIGTRQAYWGGGLGWVETPVYGQELVWLRARRRRGRRSSRPRTRPSSSSRAGRCASARISTV